MTLKTRHRGSATEYGILLALVAGVSLYGLQTLGPALSGNFKKVDSIGTLSLLAPLGASGAGQHSGGSPGDAVSGAQGNGPNGANPIISGPRGMNNVLDDPDQISDTPGYDNLASGSLGQEGQKPAKENEIDKNPAPKPPKRPPSNESSSESYIQISAPIAIAAPAVEDAATADVKSSAGGDMEVSL